MTQHGRPGPSLVILGGGFAGASLAIHLLDAARGPLELTIVERRAALGRGLAYSGQDPAHLVNGPAGIFSLYEAEPEHFTRWALARAGETGWTPPAEDPGAGFAPRQVYGDYVESELARAVRAARGRVAFRHLRAEAEDLRIRAGQVEVRTDAGPVLAEAAVLATGVFPLAEPAAAAGRPPLATPWDGAEMARIAERGGEVLIIGASLSMADAVATLEARGFRGRYLVVSRRGHLIEARREPEPGRDFLGEGPLPRSARALLATVIRERRALLAAGGDWQALPAALRPHLAALWAGASDAERRRFARHLRALWDVTLHRAAPPTYAAVERARAEGRFAAAAARVLRMERLGRRRMEATLRLRGETGEVRQVFDAVIDCRGHQEHDWRRIDAPLVRRLVESGTVRPHATGFGIDATADGRVIDALGAPQDELRAIGHPLRGVAWESSSITEQRAQATALAARLLAEMEAEVRSTG